ncbi:MAG: hypothetical protein HOP19_07650 [Acidobacteria bacterium]|nr:hypothetical protein [Acidobacteriota bacterium]
MCKPLFYFVILGFLLCCFDVAGVSAQALPLTNSSKETSAKTYFRYVFVNERFTIPRLEVEFDGAGAGQYTFKRKDLDEITNKLKISNSLLAQINTLFDEAGFLNSQASYQHKKDFSHLGTMTITLKRSGQERSTTFNYTDNEPMARLAEIFRNIATQEMRVFEIENTRQSDPISTPAQMRQLESELKGKHIADPAQLLPLLKDIQQDEGIPLIARNHAGRLMQMIQKNKF